MQFCSKSITYKIGENKANVNGFANVFVKLLALLCPKLTKFRPARSGFGHIGSAQAESERLVGDKGRGIGDRDLLPAGWHHADQLNVAGALRGQAGGIGKGLGGAVVQGDVSAALHVGTVADHGKIGGGSGQRVEVRSRVGSLGGIGIQRVSGVDLYNVGGTDVERDAGRAVDGGDQHSHILMARDIGGGSQGKNAGQLDAQVVPVADLIADFDLDRSIGAGLAAAQQSSRA